MSDFRLETGRLLLREMTQEDYPALAAILQDPQVMYAYEHAFSPGETQAWLDRQRDRYALYGHGLWAVVLKETGRMIGQCGLTWQVWRDSTVLEVGYHLRRDCWGRGYATEAAQVCIRHAFEVLDAPGVHTIIRDTNLASQAVARRCGLKISDRWIKHYRGMEMPHLLFRLDFPVPRPQKQLLPLTVRQARPGDREAVERLTREAFWDVHRPGCSEPLLVHRLWTSPALVPELALVAQGGARPGGQHPVHPGRPAPEGGAAPAGAQLRASGGAAGLPEKGRWPGPHRPGKGRRPGHGPHRYSDLR